MTVQRNEAGTVANISFIDHRTRCCFSTDNYSHFFDLRDFQQMDRQAWSTNMQADYAGGREDSGRSELIREIVKETMVTMLTTLFSEGSRHYEDEAIMAKGRHR